MVWQGHQQRFRRTILLNLQIIQSALSREHSSEHSDTTFYILLTVILKAVAVCSSHNFRSVGTTCSQAHDAVVTLSVQL
jgi:hypothetical protein